MLLFFVILHGDERSIGFAIGFIVGNVVMNVVMGAVNTLIVCWADSPSRIKANHPELSEEMIQAWSLVVPRLEQCNQSLRGSMEAFAPIEAPVTPSMYGAI